MEGARTGATCFERDDAFAYSNGADRSTPLTGAQAIDGRSETFADHSTRRSSIDADSASLVVESSCLRGDLRISPEEDSFDGRPGEPIVAGGKDGCESIGACNDGGRSCDRAIAVHLVAACSDAWR